MTPDRYRTEGAELDAIGVVGRDLEIVISGTGSRSIDQSALSNARLIVSKTGDLVSLHHWQTTPLPIAAPPHHTQSRRKRQTEPSSLTPSATGLSFDPLIGEYHRRPAIAIPVFVANAQNWGKKSASKCDSRDTRRQASAAAALESRAATGPMSEDCGEFKECFS